MMQRALNTILRWITIAGLACASIGVAAQQCERTKFIYINGVWNFNTFSAAASVVEIKASLARAGITEEVEYIWNPGAPVSDLLEVAYDQIPMLSLVGKLFLDGYKETLLNWFGLKISAHYSPGSNENYHTSRRSIIDEIKRVILQDVQTHKRPIVLIAHSQGNIYANLALQELRADPIVGKTPGLGAVGIVGLGVAAAPDTIPSRNYDYITIGQDSIIIGLLQKLGQVPSPNYFIDDAYILEAKDKDASLHTITETYLSQSINKTFTLPTGQVIPGETPEDSFVRIFKKVRAAVEADWPCLADVQAPDTAELGQTLQVSAKFIARPGDTRTITGSARLELGSSACTSSVGLEGLMKCTLTAVPPVGLQPLAIKAVLDVPFSAANNLYFNQAIGAVKVTDSEITWIEFKQGNPALPGDGKSVSSTCPGWVQVPGQPFGSCYVPKDPISVSRYVDGLTLTIFEVVSSSVVRPEDQEWATRPWIHFDVDRSRRIGSCYNGLGVITLMNPYSGATSVNGVNGRSVSYGPADLQVLIDIMNRQIGQIAISLGMSCASINANDLLILDIRPSFWVLSGVAAYTYTSTVQPTVDAIAIGRGIDKTPK